MAAELEILEDAAGLQARANSELIGVVREAVQARGRASVALSGGSTPKGLYQRLARERSLPWDRIHLFFGDERHVPPDHADSNYRMAKEAMFDPLIQAGALPASNVHRVRAELPSAAEAAASYEEELRAHFGAQVPELDLILLGMGPDGHTASLFPHTPGLEERTRWVIANPVAKLSTERITFTYPVINAAREVVFLVAGAEKAEPLRQVLKVDSASVSEYPSKGVSPRGRLLFLADKAAASKVR